MKLNQCLISLSVLLTLTPWPVQANQSYVDTIQSQWVAVPNTSEVNPRRGLAGQNTHISVNRVLNSSRVEFDVVDEGGSYARLIGNCRSNRIKMLRFGGFVSQNQVVFTKAESKDWYNTNSYQQKLLKTACYSR